LRVWLWMFLLQLSILAFCCCILQSIFFVICQPLVCPWMLSDCHLWLENSYPLLKLAILYKLGHLAFSLCLFLSCMLVI
jgi:hypothetical protein